MLAAMRLQSSSLARNALAGAKLALFLPVRAVAFRVSPAALVALIVLNAVLWFAGDWWRVDGPGTLDRWAAVVFLAQIAVLLGAALAIASVYARPEMLLRLAVVWSACDWVFELVGWLVRVVLEQPPPILPAALGRHLPTAYLVWAALVLIRAVGLAGGFRTPRFAAGATICALLVYNAAYLMQRPEIWVARSLPQEPPPSVAREAVFHRQQTLLPETLAAIAPERPGVVDLYFLGVAPYASQDVFLREMRAVRELLDDRFDTRGRSLTLINNPATLSTEPIATTTHLRRALAHFGQVMNRDEDVLLLFITSHGERRHALAFDLYPLELDQLTPAMLAEALEASGIRWKVLVISACYSGGFVDSLRNEETLVITAADARSTSFGCSHENAWTYFGRAFFDDALRRTRSFVRAFDLAREAVGAQERREQLDPSKPQIHVGAALLAKLDALERRLERIAPRPAARSDQPGEQGERH